MHWFKPQHFQHLKSHSDALHRLQEDLANARLIVIDQISMVGRQMMGRIDARLRQAKAGQNFLDYDLGGVSSVCVGDPAQCEALFDQQIYDLDRHKDTATDAPSMAARLSNKGLDIYASFDDVVLLTTCHRLCTINKEELTTEETAYNE
eukprot:7678472-Prorocentrum_lima.AAC.1